MLETMRHRRSIRKFRDGKLTDEEVNRLLNAGLLAPSGHNMRPVEFFVVQDRETIDRLAACREGAAGAALKTAPLAIVVTGCHDRSDIWDTDAAIAATHILLEASASGLGACWMQVAHRPCGSGTSEEAVRNLLKIAPALSVLCVLAVGHPDETKEPYDLEKLDRSKVHWL